MKRFIRYLYEYEQGKRMRNVGFVKVEQDGGESTVHIHGKGFRLSGMESLKVSLFYREGTHVLAVPQGEIAYMGPALNYRLRYTGEDTGTPDNYDTVCGMLLESSGGRWFAAVWDDGPLDVENIRLFTAKSESVERGREAEEEEGVPAGGAEAMREPASEAVQKPASETVQRPVSEAVQKPVSEAVQEAETQASAAGRAAPVSGGRRDAAGGMPAAKGAEAQADTAEEPVCPWQVKKIQRREISMLPRCEWRLANNNFLMHGYYNYRHLVLLDDGRILKLGVPGIYHEKEAEIAGNMGFPEFIEAARTKLSLAPEECDEEQVFGYWCRQVRRPPM